MKYLIFLITIAFFVSCNSNKDADLEVDESTSETESQFNPHDFGDGDGSQVISGAQTLLSQTDEGYRTFKSLNMTYAKLTGVSPVEVEPIYQVIQTSLAAESHPDLATRFHALAAARLADAYCHLYIERDKLGVNFSTATANQISNKFIDNFLDERKPGDYNYIRIELEKLLNNEVIDPFDGTRFIDPVANTSEKNKRLSKLACVALFASYPIAGNPSIRNFGN
ncbi:hypothetical protein N9N67_02170 [Bacteriovoracaceae bacterium]|nr:hypothetical protein [Bacteriovoracaceae bacterium]